MGTQAKQVALVTGAAQGIGEAIARRLAQAGMRVALGDINEEQGNVTMKRMIDEGVVASDHIVCHPVDVSRSDSISAWMDQVEETWGTIDFLVNNAGIQLNQAALELTDEEWRKVLGVDLDGVFFGCREAGRRMVKKGSGGIVNISSIATRFGMPRRIPYGVGKAGAEALTRILAVEWAPLGIRVNAVGPGYVETELNRYAFAQGHINREEIVNKIPLARLADPSEIAETVHFLLSPAASYITGQILYTDGGYTIAK